MAVYTFRNKRSGKLKEYEMPIKDYDQFKLDHPNLERVMDHVGIAFRGRGDRTATELAVARDPGWGEVLSKIGQQNPHTDLNANYTKNKKHKTLKAEAVVEKHVKIQQKQREAYARKR